MHDNTMPHPPNSNTTSPISSLSVEELLPSSIEAERFILSALLIGDQGIWDQIMNILRATDFHKHSHQDIFKIMEGFYQQGRCGDLLSVSEELKKQQKLDSIGGAAYLAELVESSASLVSAEECARVIKEKSVLRKIIHLCAHFRQKAMSQNFSALDVFIDSLEKEFFKFTEHISKQELISVSSLVKDSLDRLEELSHKKISVTGVPTSFTELDHLTSGFQPGELTIIAARPSMGKTAISLNIALSASLEGKKIAFFSVEMAREQIIKRLLSLAGKIPLSDLRTGQMESAAWDQLVYAASRLSEVSFFIDDSSIISPFEIRSRARRLKSRNGLDLIIVDYLQLMSLKTPMESREREVSEISRLLKSMAKELNVPVVALSQLNRGVEGRSNRRPMLADLRESGSLEQDADVIMMLYRDEYYNENSEEKGQAEVILNKQRNGPTGTVKLRWNPIYGLFENNIVMETNVPPPESPIPF